MSAENPVPFKRFRATVETADQAREILGTFYRKFGSLDGQYYLCSEREINHLSEGGYVAQLGFVQWPYPVSTDEGVNFDTLIAQFGAVVC